jgi:hypothetical protein
MAMLFYTVPIVITQSKLLTMNIISNTLKHIQSYAVIALIIVSFMGISYVSAQETPQGMHTRMGIPAALQDRMINLSRNVAGKMESAISRLENIAARTSERIDTIGAQGIDVTSARTSLDEATQKLLEARSTLETVSKDIENAFISDTPRDSFRAIRPRYTEVRVLIKDAYLKLHETLLELKGATKEAGLNKNTTPEENPVTTPEVISQ